MPNRTAGNLAGDVVRAIDIRGQICPYTLIETRDALKTLATGQVLDVLCDYEPAATITIPSFCAKKRYPLAVTREGPTLWRMYIQKVD
jgi:TusA-related sulfurtransferase